MYAAGTARRWAIRLLWCTVASWAWVVPASPALADDNADRDAARVLCLSANQRANLADAAVSLGVADGVPSPGHLLVKGRDLTIDDWRGTHRADFDRTCTAMAGAQRNQAPAKADPGGLWPSVNVLLPVLVGAALTWLASWRTGAVGRGRLRADNLRAAAENLLRSGEEYVAQWADPARRSAPSAQQLQNHRADLELQLRHVAALHPHWTEPRRLRQALSDNGPKLSDAEWAKLVESERATRIDEVRTMLQELASGVERVALAVERPGLPHRDMRRAHATASIATGP